MSHDHSNAKSLDTAIKVMPSWINFSLKFYYFVKFRYT